MVLYIGFIMFMFIFESFICFVDIILGFVLGIVIVLILNFFFGNSCDNLCWNEI